MKTLFLLVVCLYTINLAAAVASAAAATTTTTTMTTLTLVSTTPTMKRSSCFANGTITAEVSDWVGSASASKCEKANVDGHTINITGCPIGTNVTVNLYKAAITPLPLAVLMNASVDKVETIYLMCTPSPDGKVYHAQLDFPGSDTSSVISVKETINLAMRLTEADTSTAPTVVVIGTSYALHISGAGTHFMKIKNCTATTDSEMTNPVPIYDASTVADSLHIITNEGDDTGPGHGSGSHPIKASLTGFRLVASHIVFLQCDIYVCTTHVCPKPSAKRKRTKSNLKSASITFEVMGKQSARSANGAREMYSAGKNMVTIALVIVATYLSL